MRKPPFSETDKKIARDFITISRMQIDDPQKGKRTVNLSDLEKIVRRHFSSEQEKSGDIDSLIEFFSCPPFQESTLVSGDILEELDRQFRQDPNYPRRKRNN